MEKRYEGRNEEKEGGQSIVDKGVKAHTPGGWSQIKRDRAIK